MHSLARQVRFWIEPFGCEPAGGYNSYAGRPCGVGLGLYLALWVHLSSEPDRQTGFIINVSQIDERVRSEIVPFFSRRIGNCFKRRLQPGLEFFYALMLDSLEPVKKDFAPLKLEALEVELNPYRKISLTAENPVMITFTEKFEFAAMHRLWNQSFSPEENAAAFGKCANPTGHGHNYILDVAVRISDTKPATSWLEKFEEIVQKEFLSIVDHKNLNIDVPQFGRDNPTVENIASFAWSCLNGKFLNCRLEKITVWENDRTYCTYTNKEK